MNYVTAIIHLHLCESKTWYILMNQSILSHLPDIHLSKKQTMRKCQQINQFILLICSFFFRTSQYIMTSCMNNFILTRRYLYILSTHFVVFYITFHKRLVCNTIMHSLSCKSGFLSSHRECLSIAFSHNQTVFSR